MGVEKILSPWNIQISWSEWSFIRTVLLIIHSDHPSSIHRYYKPILFIIVRFCQKTIKSFDYVIMIIDLADEILEFTNLVVVTLFFPFLPPWDIYDDLLYL